MTKEKVSCADCSLARLCFPTGLERKYVEELDRIIRRRRPLKRRERLFTGGDTQVCLYAIRSGALKTRVTTAAGEERVLGFHLPGELVGLDALEHGMHVCTAIALESTSVCEVPFSPLLALCGTCPRLNERVHRLIGAAIAGNLAMLSVLGRRSAEARLASFLLSLAARFKRRGFSSLDFRLSMTRQDIGNHLGLALGTVSRLFTQLDEDGVLGVSGRSVHILSQARLVQMVGLSVENLPELA